MIFNVRHAGYIDLSGVSLSSFMYFQILDQIWNAKAVFECWNIQQFLESINQLSQTTNIQDIWSKQYWTGIRVVYTV